jgi:hypothetical protein
MMPRRYYGAAAPPEEAVRDGAASEAPAGKAKVGYLCLCIIPPLPSRINRKTGSFRVFVLIAETNSRVLIAKSDNCIIVHNCTIWVHKFHVDTNLQGISNVAYRTCQSLYITANTVSLGDLIRMLV